MNYCDNLKRMSEIDGDKKTQRKPLLGERSIILTHNQLTLVNLCLLVGYHNLEKEIQDKYLKEKLSLQNLIALEDSERTALEQDEWDKIYKAKLESELEANA